MLILAVEQSTMESTAVIADDDEVLLSTSWQESRLRSQQFFSKIKALLSKADRQISDIELFAAGTGPGSFNALRMCISAMESFALPSRSPLYAVSSAQALALQLSTNTGMKNISIVGDARRGHLWLATTGFRNGRLPSEYSLQLISPDELEQAVAGADVIASPDFDRIADILAVIPGSKDRLHYGPAYPHARFIAETAFSAAADGLVSPPFRPTYLHPAV